LLLESELGVSWGMGEDDPPNLEPELLDDEEEDEEETVLWEGSNGDCDAMGGSWCE
jgi:hypothetical protein